MIGCVETRLLDDTEYMAAFRRRSKEQRIPISGGINLTNHCNLRCVHCYIRDCKGDGSPDLPTERILSILDELADAGCLFFLITGGEPLLHPDFHLIYRHARKLGMLVSVFTNGTLLDESHIELFQELPPHHVEITLYGATEKTFSAVTGSDTAFADCHRGIQLLREGDVRFGLKAMLMTLTQDEVEAMREFASNMNVNFRLDPMIGPRLDGDLTPLQYRVDAETAAATEMTDHDTASKRLEYHSQLGSMGRRDYLYKCGTGTTGFFIDSSGKLQPCMMVTDPSYDISNSSFMEAWDRLRTVRDLPAPPDMPCRDCDDLPYCGYCPPVMDLENGMQVEPCSYTCQLGRARTRAVKEFADEFRSGESI